MRKVAQANCRAARIAGTVLHPPDHFSPCRIEGCECIDKRFVPPARVDRFRSLDPSGAIRRQRCDFCLASGLLEGLVRHRRCLQPREELALRLDHVLHALQNGPSLRRWPAHREGFVYPGHGLLYRVTAGLQCAQDLGLLAGFHWLPPLRRNSNSGNQAGRPSSRWQDPSCTCLRVKFCAAMPMTGVCCFNAASIRTVSDFQPATSVAGQQRLIFLLITRLRPRPGNRRGLFLWIVA